MLRGEGREAGGEGARVPMNLGARSSLAAVAAELVCDAAIGDGGLPVRFRSLSGTACFVGIAKSRRLRSSAGLASRENPHASELRLLPDLQPGTRFAYSVSSPDICSATMLCMDFRRGTRTPSTLAAGMWAMFLCKSTSVPIPGCVYAVFCVVSRSTLR